MENTASLVADQRAFFLNGNTMEYDFRKKQLQKLKNMLKDNEPKIYRALKKDLNKSKHEVLSTELGMIYTEIDLALRHLKYWMAPEKVPSPMTHRGSKSFVIKEPYGVALIISPWNYPLQLALMPVIGAMAAGNCIILKPSEHAQATSRLLAQIVSTYFDPPYFTVVEGDQTAAQALLKEMVDYIFFTGKTENGKSVMKEASNHLTPVTLQLGGKNPVIVDEDANINLAAKRIVWGKFTNAGQSCAAPDYVYVHETSKFRLLKFMIKHIKAFYGQEPLKNPDYTRIINESHFSRLMGYIEEGKVIHGGNADPESLTIEPTLLDKASWEDKVMQEEIFGPVLPILPFVNIEDALFEIKQREKPLALYYFGDDDKTQQQVMEYISFGGGAVNDSMYHLTNPHLPFGGVGSSGMGSYRGSYSFYTFSHQKGILKQTTKFDLPFRYPGSKFTNTILDKFLD